MPVVYLPKGSIMKWIDPALPGTENAISEHNRKPVQVEVERIEKTHRMANGTMRKYVVADKRTFSTSWEGLPNVASKTVDGKWGADEIENFYNTITGPFTLKIIGGDGSVKTYTVMFTNFNKSIARRGVYDFVDVDITLEEV